MKEVYDSLSDAPFKIRKEDIIPENIQIDWLWLSSAKEQGKSNTLPPPNSLAHEDHFDIMCSTISDSINSKGKLSNVTLRIQVRLTIKPTGDNGDPITYQEEPGRRQVILLKLNH